MKYTLNPFLTEKSASKIKEGLYVFRINGIANKIQVSSALKSIYNVDAVSVRIVNLPAKKVNFKRKSGTQSMIKKAYVQLRPKQEIHGFESLKENKDTSNTKEKS